VNRESNVNVVPFTETIQSLALAPLAGLAVLTFAMLMQAGTSQLPHGPAVLSPGLQPHIVFLAPWLALYIAPFCYGAAVLFVLPVLIMWPRLRRPSYAVAAVWGAFAAWAAVAVLSWLQNLRPSVGQILRQMLMPPVEPAALFGGAGAVSGVVYARLARRRSTKEHSH
jgi:hypothetical protein